VSQFLHDPRLHDIADRHDLEVVFCLHPNMARFMHLFADMPVRVISQGEVDVQYLLKQSAMLVTDYSSVAFDFSFLHRPVAYYQFDRERFLGFRGSHLDLDHELPGPITHTAGHLLTEVERAAGRDFVMESEYVRRADRFITHRDQQNCDRIFEAVKSAKRRHTRIKDLAASELPTTGMRRFRRSRVYFPAMRAMFRLLRKLPADPNRVVFESGVGRQYADSPRYVYEELVRRGSGLKKIWAYRGKIHTQDQNTTSVLRLSVSYYFHLARGEVLGQQPELPALHRAPTQRCVPADVARHAAQTDVARPHNDPRSGQRIRRQGHQSRPTVERAGLTQPIRHRRHAQRLPLCRAGDRGGLPPQRRLLPP